MQQVHSVKDAATQQPVPDVEVRKAWGLFYSRYVIIHFWVENGFGYASVKRNMWYVHHNIRGLSPVG